MNRVCGHGQNIQPVQAKTEGCEECLQSGDSWVQLRKCLSCGHVGCCDSSKNRHATAHYKATGHPVMESYQVSQVWRWCYVDEAYLPAQSSN